MTLLAATDVSYRAPDGRVLATGLSFGVEEGDVLLVTGPNGAGKTTLLKVLIGKHPLAAGNLALNISSREVSYLPQMQQGAFHLPLTLRDVLAIAHKGRFDLAAVLSWGLLKPTHLDLAWNTASGGEKRRTLMTRALLGAPRLLILDEPLNHLDRETRQLVSGVIERFVTGAPGRAVVLVSHEPPRFSATVRLKTLALAGGDDDE